MIYLYICSKISQTKNYCKKMKLDKFGISNENFDEALDGLLEESGKLTDEILKNEK